MLISMEDLNPIERYQMMIQTIVPRPIAWVLTKNPSHHYNLAPFSYFNALTSNPPLFFLSIGYRRDKRKKDTRLNIEREKDFVVHIASVKQREAVTHTSLSFEPEVSEVEEAGLELVEEKGFGLPRLKECLIAYYCRYERTLEIGENKQGVILGELKQLYLDESIIDKAGKVPHLNIDALQPLGRLGGNDYYGNGEVMEVDRPDYHP